MTEWAQVALAVERRNATRNQVAADPHTAPRSALIEQVLTDPLTGAGTRAALVQCRDGDALTYIDLDGFKAVNDDVRA